MEAHIRVPWFRKSERIAKLEAVAVSWVGTPFRPHGKIKGEGCSCETLCCAIYQEIGFAPAGLELPRLSLRHYRAQGESLIKSWMDKCPWFVVVAGEPQEGDMLLFLSRECEHSGICLTGGRFISAMIHRGAQVHRWNDATFAQHLARIWRPIEEEV